MRFSKESPGIMMELHGNDDGDDRLVQFLKRVEFAEVE